MEVFYDISFLGAGYRHPVGRTGIFRFVRTLAEELRKLPDIRLSWTTSTPTDTNLNQCRDFIRSEPGFEGPPFHLPTEAPAGAVLHSLWAPFPESVSNRADLTRLLTVQDLIPILYPHWVPPPLRERFAQRLRSVGERDTFVCPSEATRRDLCEYLDLPPERARVVYPAADDCFRPSREGDNAPYPGGKLGFGDHPYLLSVCTLEPRKNLGTALKAFAHLRRRQRLEDLYLVLAGAPGWGTRALEEMMAADPELKTNVVLTGFVAEEDLRELYRRAVGFLYPSRYEGFGLPVLEAMKSGTPVITTPVASLPEVGGNAALYVEPDDWEGLADAMGRLYGDSELRTALIARGLEQASRFSWRKTAEATLRIYREAAARTGNYS